MTEKRKISYFVLKLYITICITIIAFFVLYAFRFGVFDKMYQKGYIKFENVEMIKKRLEQKLNEEDFKFENYTKTQKLLKKELPTYEFHLWKDVDWLYGMTSQGNWYDHRLIKYEKEITLSVADRNLELVLIPNIKKFTDSYIIFCLAVSISLFIFLWYFIKRTEGYRLIQKLIIKLFQCKLFKHMHTLSRELLLTNIIAFLFTAGIFTILYQNRYAPLEFIRDVYSYDEVDEKANLIQADIKNMVWNSSKFEKIEKKYIKDSSNISLERKDGKSAIAYSPLDYYGNGLYHVLVLRNEVEFSYMLNANHESVLLSISYMPFAKYVIPYMVLIILVSFSYYIIILQLFMKQKIKAIISLQQDASILSGGDWNHGFNYYGNDEIGQLGEELRSMQKSFHQNMEDERQARKANQELVTALSHDLRTPLTSLNGYLELIRYREGSTEQKLEYLDRSLQKVEQIRSLSDQLFEYFTVFDKDEDLELPIQPLTPWIAYIQENVEFMRADGVDIQMELDCMKDCEAAYQQDLMRRAMDNLFSNLHKYADRKVPIEIRITCKEHHIHVVMENAIRQDGIKVESNRIGLKSVAKIMKLQKGYFKCIEKDGRFSVELILPVIHTE